jgi:hypoxanthine phosphoribosyltransferase
MSAKSKTAGRPVKAAKAAKPSKAPAPRAAAAKKAPARSRKRVRAEQPLGVGVGDAWAVERLGGLPPAASSSAGGVRELTWVEFGAVVRDLASRVSARFQPDVILGVARGGIFVGGALAAPMRADFLPVRVEKRSRDRRAVPTFRVPEARGKRVLVVDDVTSSGATLGKAKALARRSGAKEIQAAALVVRPGGSRPEWFALETAQLIVFPWDYQLDASGPLGDPGSVGV